MSKPSLRPSVYSMGSGGDAAIGGRRRRVLFFPFPYQGHINPMFHLAGLLHLRGLAVTIFHTVFNAPDPSHHPAFDFVHVPIPGGIPMPSNLSTVQSAVELLLAVNRACEAPFRESLTALLEKTWGDEDVACLIADTNLLTMMEVARQLGVPTLALRTSSAAWLRWFLAHPMLYDKGYLPATQLDAPVMELPPYRVRDLMPRGGAGHGVAREVISRVVTAATTSRGLIINTFDALEADELAAVRRDLAVPVFDVGPLHLLSPATSSSLLPQDRSCLDWLDAQVAPGSVLYISFGSLVSMSASDLAEMAWGVANSGRPFLWVIRPGLVGGGSPSQPPQLPDGFDATARGPGKVVSWVPQDEVLAHSAVGAFLTHCGWNSTLESVCAGVPMLCRPCVGDQMGNARYVDHVWQVGMTLDGDLERGKVEAAIATVMGGEERSADMRRRAQELKGRAAECITVAGSSRLTVDKLVSHIMSL